MTSGRSGEKVLALARELRHAVARRQETTEAALHAYNQDGRTGSTTPPSSSRPCSGLTLHMKRARKQPYRPMASTSSAAKRNPTRRGCAREIRARARTGPRDRRARCRSTRAGDRGGNARSGDGRAAPRRSPAPCPDGRARREESRPNARVSFPSRRPAGQGAAAPGRRAGLDQQCRTSAVSCSLASDESVRRHHAFLHEPLCGEGAPGTDRRLLPRDRRTDHGLVSLERRFDLASTPGCLRVRDERAAQVVERGDDRLGRQADGDAPFRLAPDERGKRAGQRPAGFPGRVLDGGLRPGAATGSSGWRAGAGGAALLQRLPPAPVHGPRPRPLKARRCRRRSTRQGGRGSPRRAQRRGQPRRPAARRRGRRCGKRRGEPPSFVPRAPRRGRAGRRPRAPRSDPGRASRPDRRTGSAPARRRRGHRRRTLPPAAGRRLGRRRGWRR